MSSFLGIYANSSKISSFFTPVSCVRLTLTNQMDDTLKLMNLKKKNVRRGGPIQYTPPPHTHTDRNHTPATYIIKRLNKYTVVQKYHRPRRTHDFGTIAYDGHTHDVSISG